MNTKIFEQLIGKILIGFRKDGVSFTAKLIEIDGYMLIFVNSHGNIFIHDISDIARLREKVI